MHYRKDINGLKGVAVLLVFLFHTEILFTGGFIGVDIFFVLSGYFITKSMIEKKDSFRLGHFYKNKIKRIYTPMLLPIITTWLVCLTLLTAEKLISIKNSMLATLILVPNVFFWSESGYFDSAASTKPLLHLWTIGIEMQFYMLAGLLFLLCKKNIQALKKVWLLLTGASFIISYFYTSNNITGSYLLIESRLWVIGTGVLIALYNIECTTNKKWINNMQYVCIGTLLILANAYDTTTIYPGLYALPVSLLTGFYIILQNNKENNYTGLLRSPLLQAIGTYSFGIYLWHWPLMVLWRIHTTESISITSAIVILAISFVLSYVQIHYKSTKLAFNPFTIRSQYVAITCIAFFTVFNNFQHQELYASTINEEAINQWQNVPYTILNIKEPELKASYMLWGDSHARQYKEAFSSISEELGINGYLVEKSACVPLFEVNKDEEAECQTMKKELLMFLKTHNIKHIFIASRWTAYAIGRTEGVEEYKKIPLLDEYSNKDATGEEFYREKMKTFERSLDRTIQYLQKEGVNIYLFNQPPELSFDPSLLKATDFKKIQSIAPQKKDVRKRQGEINAILKKVTEQYKATLIKVQEKFCTRETCIVMYDGKFLYRDDDHLSQKGAEFVSSSYKEYLISLSDSNH